MAREKQVPMIYQGGFTGAWWCATRWKERPDGTFEALEKFDVTGQIEEILEAHEFAATVAREPSGSMDE